MTDTGPIQVKQSAVPGLVLQGGGILAIAASGYLFRAATGSESVVAAIMQHPEAMLTIGSFGATWVWRGWEHLKSHRQKVAMALAAPNSVAVVKA